MADETPTPVVAPAAPTPAADDNARKVLAALIVAQFLAIVGFIIYKTTTKDASNAEMMILGTESVLIGAVVNFYFGSSSGSVAKDARQAQGK